MAGSVKKIKKRVFEIISKAEDGDQASKIFDWSIMILIALSIISIILESFASIYDKYHSIFQVFEIITVVVFTIEYLLRIWTADLLFLPAGFGVSEDEQLEMTLRSAEDVHGALERAGLLCDRLRASQRERDLILRFLEWTGERREEVLEMFLEMSNQVS